MDVREILARRPLLFDGGMGTYYKTAPGQECEQANLLDPAGVQAVHRAYLNAGADAITWVPPTMQQLQRELMDVNRAEGQPTEPDAVA